MVTKLLATGLVSLAIFISVAVVAEAPVPTTAAVSAKAPTKSEVCAACHGVEGNSSVGMWPKLAGQHEAYIIKELKEFRKGEKGGRNDPSMVAMAQGLTDEDIQELAIFYATQKATPGGAKQELLSLGEKIYRGGNLKTGVTACIACHGPSGDGNAAAKYPRLSGQQAEYTVMQLKKFRTGTRSSDPNGIMRDIAKRMSDEEIQAVSDYVSGLH
jgi:cytochrome c553